MLINKQELCNILNIKTRTLKQIEADNKLHERLENKGYKLINRTKEGRSILYEIELINENKEVYSNLCKYVFNTNKEDEFTKYFTIRTLSDSNFEIPLSGADIAHNIDISSKTITKWDNTLIDNDILIKDGYYYFCIDKDKETITQCTIEEYKSFWKNKAMINAFKSLQIRYIKGEITLNELTLASADIGATYAILTNKYYYRIKKYITNKDNQLYIDTIELIKNIYGSKEYKIKLLE